MTQTCSNVQILGIETVKTIFSQLKSSAKKVEQRDIKKPMSNASYRVKMGK